MTKKMNLTDASEVILLESGGVIQIKKESNGTQFTSGLSLRLMPRDYELFSFLLDQKFASLEAIYYRFFDRRTSVHALPPTNYFVARQRLQLLRRAGLLSTERVYSESKSVYLLTPMGLKALEGISPDRIYAKAARDVDFRNYDHDRRVNLVRIALERQKRVVRWWSERRLRMERFKWHGIEQTLPEEIVPDGIFVNPEGLRIAVEVEASNRMKRRFEEKIRSYRSVMNSYRPEAALIHRVLFVSCGDAIKAKLSKCIDPESREFLLEDYPYFLSTLYSKKAEEATP